MKNANSFVDVDLTLVDGSGRLLPSARAALARLREAGCHLFRWSTNGAQYATKVARLLGLEGWFEGYAAKLDIVIDDMPGIVLNRFVFDVSAEESWPALAEKSLPNHVGKSECFP